MKKQHIKHFITRIGVALLCLSLMANLSFNALAAEGPPESGPNSESGSGSTSQQETAPNSSAPPSMPPSALISGSGDTAVMDGSGASSIPFGGKNIPLGSFFSRVAGWSLVNLILTILDFLLLGTLLIIMFKKKFSLSLFLVINSILAVVTLLIFLFTSDFTNPVILVNYMTLLLLVLSLVQIFFFVLYNVRRKGEKEGDDQITA